MMPLRYIPRWARPWFLPALTVIAVVALFGAVFAVIRAGEIQAVIQRQAERDRITFDLASCKAGNEFRSDVKEGFAAVDQAINGVLDVASSPPFRARIAAPLAVLKGAASSIELRDCDQAVADSKG